MANQQGNGRNVSSPDENRPSWRPQDESEIRGRRSTSDEDRYMSRDRDEDRYMSRDRGYWGDRSSRYDRDEGYRSTERYGQGQSGYGGGRYDDDRSFSSRNVGYPGHMEERARERGVDERFSQGRGGSSWGERGGYERGERSVGGGGYGHGRYEPRGGYSSQPDQRMSAQQYYEEPWGNEGYAGGQTSYGDQSGYGAPGMYGGGHLRGGQRGHERGTYGQRGYEQRGYERGGQRSVRDQGGLYGEGGYTEGMYGPSGGMQNRFGSQGYQGWGQQPGAQSHRGKGPSGYMRSDERVRELVCEALSDDHNVDATNIEVSVKNGEVTLSGTVDDRMQKRMAEDCVEQIAGVKDVQNQLRVVSERKPAGKESTAKDITTGKESESPTTTGADKRHRA